MEQTHLACIVHQPGTARTADLGPNKVTFLLTGEETGGIFSLTEFEAAPPPAPAAPIHVHHDANETIYVLDGEFQVTIDGQVTAVQTGSAVFVPRDTPHTIGNVGTTRGKMLVILAPPGFEGYWDEMSRLMKLAGGPVDPALVLATQAKYHMDTQGQARKFADN